MKRTQRKDAKTRGRKEVFENPFTRPRLSAPLRLCVLFPFVCLVFTGCIRSRVTITSEPSGAEVVWRGKPRGATPITIPFEWYWYYDFSLEKEGYEKKELVERFRTPPWFLMPLDLFAELAPVPISDHRYRHYELKKKEEKGL